MPRMGISTTPPQSRQNASLADALFMGTQQRVLGLLFGQPDRSFYATEIIALAGGGGCGALLEKLALPA